MADAVVKFHIPAAWVDEAVANVVAEMRAEGHDVDSAWAQREIERGRARLDQTVIRMSWAIAPPEGA